MTLLRATLTLLAGGALAQGLPLLLGPLLTRLYAPAEFGAYHLFAAVAANVAVVACARYEFALPLARSDDEARALVAVCLRLLVATTVLATLASAAWAVSVGASWPLWLGPAVAALGLASLATLAATRARRFRALAAARVVQHGGGAAARPAAGVQRLAGAMGGRGARASRFPAAQHAACVRGRVAASVASEASPNAATAGPSHSGQLAPTATAHAAEASVASTVVAASSRRHTATSARASSSLRASGSANS